MSTSLLSGHEAKEVQSSRMPSPRKRSIGIWSRRQQCAEKGRECFSCIMWKDMHNAGLPINTNFDKSRRSCNASRTLSANCLQHRANISKFLQLLHIDIVNTFFTNSSVVDLTLFFRVTEMRRRIHMSSSVFRRFVVVSFDVKAPLRVISIDRLEMEMLVRRPVHGLIVKAVRQIKNRFIRFVNGFGQRHLGYYQQEGEQPWCSREDIHDADWILGFFLGFQECFFLFFCFSFSHGEISRLRIHNWKYEYPLQLKTKRIVLVIHIVEYGMGRQLTQNYDKN